MNSHRFLLYLWVLAFGAACHRAPSLPLAKSEVQDLSSLDSIPISVLQTENLAAVSKQSQALEILNHNCGGCHSAGNAQGNFGIIENVEEMLAGGRYLLAGSPEKSLLIGKLAPTGNMPPAGSLKQEEIDILNDWVRELKPTAILPLFEEEAINLVRKDLEQNIPLGQRAGIRYFSLHVPQNLGATSATLGILRQAFFKVINSLSHSPVIVQAKAIDKESLIFRLQLSDLAIPELQFEQIIANFYPFGQRFVAEGGNSQSLRAADDHSYLKSELATENYMLRADWFVATATLPQLYEGFLQLGADQTALQQLIGVNQLPNIIAAKVVRAGFKNSNVSSQNRIIERHVQNSGLAYWLSYDFAANEGLANVFNLPLGPLGAGQDARAFKHDGGEMIVQLPNGLLAYYLANAAGVKIDKGPTSIVKQTDAPNQFLSAIVNGISCMSCHGAGLLYKADEVRNFFAASPGDFSVDELAKVKSLFVEEKTLKELFEKDNSFYFKSLKSLGINPALPDPVSQAFRYYNRGLSRADVREELGIKEAELAQLLLVEPFRSQWTSLNSNQGYIKRDEFQGLLQSAWELFKPRVQVINPLLGDALITPQCMFADPLKTDACLLRKPPVPVTPAPVALMGRQ